MDSKVQEAGIRDTAFATVIADSLHCTVSGYSGTGPEPFEGFRYTAPGSPDMEPVIIALDNPMRIARNTP